MDEQELKHRIRNALIILSTGHSFKVGELKFECEDNKHFSVTGWTISNDFNHVTKSSALKELMEIKTLFNKMIVYSTELADFIKNKDIEFHLCYDYGMGGIGICTESNGNITWETELE
jgi:hypothetical protein